MNASKQPAQAQPDPTSHQNAENADLNETRNNSSEAPTTGNHRDRQPQQTMVPDAELYGD